MAPAPCRRWFRAAGWLAPIPGLLGAGLTTLLLAGLMSSPPAGLLTSPAPVLVAGARDPRGATIEALALLQSLLRQDTTNPPGNEVRAARVLGVFFSDQGIGCEMIEPEPGRGSLLCRVKGDGSGLPLLVVTHLDVAARGGSAGGGAPGDPRSGGGLKDGRICGPGARAGKGMAAATAEALAVLARQGSLARDILFLGAADGEGAGDWGLEWLLEHRPELGRVEGAITGGGRLIEAGGRVVRAAVQAQGPIEEGPLTEPLRRALARLAPDARVEEAAEPAPAALKLLRQKEVQALGLLPFPLEETETAGPGAGGMSARGADPGLGDEECLSLDSFELGVRLMIEWLREAASR